MNPYYSSIPASDVYGLPAQGISSHASYAQVPYATNAQFGRDAMGSGSDDGESDQDREPGSRKADQKVKRRSSKACDGCRRQKCKCQRQDGPDGKPLSRCQNCIALNTECTYLGPTRKRGPPRGYINLLESRLHRMETLLGHLVSSPDPRAQLLLTELLGDDEARDLLKQDLEATTQLGSDGKPRKIWNIPQAELNPPYSLPAQQRLQRAEFSSQIALSQGADAPMLGQDHGDLSDIEDEDTFKRKLHEELKLPAHGSAGSRKHSIHSPAGSTPKSGNERPSDAARSSPKGRILHTGTATYDAAAGSEVRPDEMSELADVIGQLSVNEHQEIRYHGRSSGLYMLSKSSIFKDFTWQFPRMGSWPPPLVPQTYAQDYGDRITECQQALPSEADQRTLLQLYWTYVHPYMPILHRNDFQRQFDNTMQDHRNGAIVPLSAGPDRVPTLLLVAIYAVTYRYWNAAKEPRSQQTYWTSGDDWMLYAKSLLVADAAATRMTTVQALLLISLREAGCSRLSQSWLYVGMATRIAQDLGLFRDVERWFMPVSKFSHIDKLVRKRVWYGCILMDKYVSAFIGRPMMIFERDFDTALPSTEVNEEEHCPWQPIRPDGTLLSEAPTMPLMDAMPAQNMIADVSSQPSVSHALTCFNESASLAVILSRIIGNVYAIRIRVIGQSSETLLSMLDSSLAKWYTRLPTHLRYNVESTAVPVPHIMTLHCSFYCALILLHRPFVPGPNAAQPPASVPSHTISTTAANSISAIVMSYLKHYGMRQASPFIIYPIFQAAIVHVSNASLAGHRGHVAKVSLARCMKAMAGMAITWAASQRHLQLLDGLVDLRGIDPEEAVPLRATLDTSATPARKRTADDLATSDLEQFASTSSRSTENLARRKSKGSRSAARPTSGSSDTMQHAQADAVAQAKQQSILYNSQRHPQYSQVLAQSPLAAPSQIMPSQTPSSGSNPVMSDQQQSDLLTSFYADDPSVAFNYMQKPSSVPSYNNMPPSSTPTHGLYPQKSIYGQIPMHSPLPANDYSGYARSYSNDLSGLEMPPLSTEEWAAYLPRAYGASQQ
ncbi:uncharacterized protein L969DRAFT_76668 [Mixia osmundae IAM 14324]|uniref:Zn(2)-C6 fungal-type domain-containing protein n=1 Tax=Mixia osmundae (strain CBS 9802 / IAM 14324 / JCM 22182 / KY 12970) TaxID=764103 RepID=G7E7R9_MIXOS|nr:uncharacterized protein L969DRAFT_76668 [Mixia osmundae IAM 14324]KEI38479.1 hypothetical protein L969DRAFT_76668 [Mixia osmundae IAM 14324]GAA98879.1 hypothetical protein E5Q_05567 [Mixia osmundae IAM 14324]